MKSHSNFNGGINTTLDSERKPTTPAKVARERELDDEQEQSGVGVQHVKDGKPLTAYGARLLGVKWRK